MAMRFVRKESVKENRCHVKESQAALPAYLVACCHGPMTRTTVVAIAVPSVLERYGAGWDDEPPSRG
ncbi:MAG TPA: hypothetical protein VED43_02435 [Mycobacterium sp.]|nr:hypothetical protein [Mycobacterium sp.]